ncbi:MAG: HD-GYP domain-containing protein [Candidatus Thiodiazotropha sp.]|nr:HD-GYP domain-containing protein [Candidatus Thiodiazotropha taylori]
MIEAEDYSIFKKRVSLLEDHIGFKVESILHYALSARDSYTLEHSNRVVSFSEVIGNHLNLDKHQMDVLMLAASFHDIGKIGIPDHILLKPGTLSKEEYEGIKAHSSIGANMLRTLGNPLLDEVAECVLHHHEQWNGKGYPEGLEGERIPIISRIIAVVDTYDAMTTTRSYRRQISKQDAMKIIESESGKQFCPNAVKVAIEICRSGEFPCQE